MNAESSHPRWNLWLPAAAALAAMLMTGLAATTRHVIAERNELALEGRLLGIAHTAETRLRDVGVGGADAVLEELLSRGGSEVPGLVLLDSNGAEVAAVGVVDSSRLRTVELFLGRFAAGDAQPRQGGGGWAHGRGRFDLRLHLDPRAGALPIVARLLIPTTALIGVALIWLATLAGRFLARQRHSLQEAAERDRLQALARAGAGLAHQLRTPLATIKGTSQLLAEQCDPTPQQLETVIAQVDRMDRLLGQLLDYARPPQPEPRSVPLGEVVSEAVGRHPGAAADIAPGATAFVDREHLVEILDNLLANALRCSPQAESVTVRVSTEGSLATVTVSDRGPGPGDDPERLFEPYVTSRADGSGLGLPIARNLAVANGGWLRLVPAANGGCDAILTLPRRETSP